MYIDYSFSTTTVTTTATTTVTTTTATSSSIYAQKNPCFHCASTQ